MKTKRWKRRNRHTRPEWVEAYRVVERYNWYYDTLHYLVVYKDNVCISDRFGNKWLAADRCLDLTF